MEQLSEQDKARIVAEEQFRAEQRKQLEKKKTSPATWGCLFLILFGIFLLIIGVGFGDDTNTTDQVAGSSPTVSPARDYATEVVELSEMHAEAALGVGELLFEKPSPSQWTEAEINVLAFNTVIIEDVYERARKLTPPSNLQEAHDRWIRGLRLTAEAMPLFREGVDTNDAAKLEQAARMINEGTREFSQASAILTKQ